MSGCLSDVTLPQAEQHDANHPDAFEFAQFSTALGVEIPFLLNIEDAYSRFYLLWQMQELLGRKNADLVIAFQDLHNDKDAVWQSLCAEGLMETSDIPICRAAIQPGSGHSGWQTWQGDEQWWSDREARAEEILQASGLCHLGLQSLSDIRQAHQPAWKAAFEQLDLMAQSRTWLCHYANARAEQTRLLARIRELESHQSS